MRIRSAMHKLRKKRARKTSVVQADSKVTFQGVYKPGKARNTPLTGWIPRNTLNCKN